MCLKIHRLQAQNISSQIKLPLFLRKIHDQRYIVAVKKLSVVYIQLSRKKIPPSYG